MSRAKLKEKKLGFLSVFSFLFRGQLYPPNAVTRASCVPRHARKKEGEESEAPLAAAGVTKLAKQNQSIKPQRFFFSLQSIRSPPYRHAVTSLSEPDRRRGANAGAATRDESAGHFFW